MVTVISTIGHEVRLAFLLAMVSIAAAFDCVEKCGSNGQPMPVGQAMSDASCLIALPDNPSQHQGNILPCHMDIQSNCTKFCHVEITFSKFHLEKCSQNASYGTGHCDQIDSCEYVLLQETGIDSDGDEYNIMTHFDGDLTSQTYRSRTDRVMLHFCYRSETFSGRNIQLVYRAIDPEAENAVYIGPVSVYVLGTLAILFAVAICVVRWSPWLKPCLDPSPPPPPAKLPSSSSFDP